MKACEICGAKLKKQKKVCSRECAGEYLSVLYHGKGTKTPYISMRLNGRKIKYHRYVWERANGRKLRHGEIVHHKNGNKRDNRPENLQVVANHAEHLRIHDYFRKERRLAREKRRNAIQRNFSELGW